MMAAPAPATKIDRNWVALLFSCAPVSYESDAQQLLQHIYYTLGQHLQNTFSIAHPNKTMRRIKLRPTQLLLDSILNRAPHQAMQRLSGVCYGMRDQTQQLQQLNKAYVEMLQYQTQCEYLLDPHFRMRDYRNISSRPVGMSTSQATLLQRSPLFTPNKQKQGRTETEQKLLTTIRKLNDSKYAYNTYSEAEEAVLMLAAADAYKNKKYLVYIYKWILNQRSWPNQEIQRMSVELKQVVVDKIYQGHENLRSEEQQRVREELIEAEHKINAKIKEEKQKENEKIDKIISSYKDKGESFAGADKNKQ